MLIFLRALALFIILPLLSHTLQAQQHITVDVATFGALPDDNTDDLPGIRAAIQSLPSQNCQLVFSAGVYDLHPRATLGPPPRAGRVAP